MENNPSQEEAKNSLSNQVVVHIKADKKYTTNITTGKHSIIADEPESYGGYDLGPTPYELLLASLGSCTAITIKMYAQRKEWELEDIDVRLNHLKTFILDENGNETSKKKDVFERKITLFGNLDDKQRTRLLEMANRCPLHRTLHGTIEINTSLVN